MEIGGSYLHLNSDCRRKWDEEKETIGSLVSLTPYEKDCTLKSYLPQILASVLAALMNIAVGMSMTYSAVLIPQLTDPEGELKVTLEESTWIVSCIMLTMPLGNFSGGFIMDKMGRLNTLKLSTIPICVGWLLIATAKNSAMILVGRMLCGVACAWGANPAFVFITEIASPSIRGSLVSFAPTFATFGMALSYALGWILPWRTFAWIANAIPIVAGLSLFVIPESPAWLVSKGKIENARKSLEWYYKYYPQLAEKKRNLAELQLNNLIRENEEKKLEQELDNKHNKGGLKIFLHEFLKPTGYKPFLIMIGLFIFQQFSGLFIVLFYAVSFNEAIGAEFDPYLASTIAGFLRFFVTVVLLILMKIIPRRTLLIMSSSLMSVFIGISGYYTSLIKEGQTTLTWIPTVCNFLYLGSSSIGIASIPWSISAEVYPLEIRGKVYSLTMTIAHLLMFSALKSYIVLNVMFGGLVGVQYFFSLICLGGAVYIFMLIPETKDKKLSDIEEYFTHNTIYLGDKYIANNAHKSKPNNRVDSTDFNKSDNEQQERMVNGV